MTTAPQPPLQTEEFKTLFELLKDGTVDQDLSVLDIFDIDSVDVSVLPHLAVHFNVIGDRGWNLADTELKQRNLLKRALELHLYKGTPFAIKLVCEILGHPIKTITENPGIFYDGSFLYDGSETYSGVKWARFDIEFNEDPTPSELKKLQALINAWKPLRSHWLVSLTPLLYDATANYDGTYTYSGYQD